MQDYDELIERAMSERNLFIKETLFLEAEKLRKEQEREDDSANKR